MIKELSEKIIKLNEKDLNKIEISFLVMVLLFASSIYIFGYIIGQHVEQDTITDKLISLSEKENNSFPDNNYFKIDNKIYEVKKVNTSYITDLSIDITHNYSIKKNSTVDDLLFEGIYGWFCYDDSSYDTAISDLTQSYLNRGCKLISIDISSVNRTYYIENGWN